MIIALLALLGLLAVTKKGGAPEEPENQTPKRAPTPVPGAGTITVTYAEDLDPLIVTPPKPWDLAKRDNMLYQKHLTQQAVYAVRGYKPDYPPKHFLEEQVKVATFLKLPKTAALIKRNVNVPFEQSELVKLSSWPHDEMWPYSNLSVQNWIRKHLDNYTHIPKKF